MSVGSLVLFFSPELFFTWRGLLFPPALFFSRRGQRFQDCWNLFELFFVQVASRPLFAQKNSPLQVFSFLSGAYRASKFCPTARWKKTLGKGVPPAGSKCPIWTTLSQNSSQVLKFLQSVKQSNFSLSQRKNYAVEIDEKNYAVGSVIFLRSFFREFQGATEDQQESLKKYLYAATA